MSVKRSVTAMTILPFEQHKEDIRKQIALLTDGVDQAASQALYQ